VLAEIDAHVVALQEVPSGTSGLDALRRFRGELAVEAIAGPTLLRRGAEYGNAILTHHRVAHVLRIDLTVPPHEPRGALDVTLDCDGVPLRVIATHLGLFPYERRRQMRVLIDVLSAGPDVPTVLMGDLNEWLLWGRPLRWLRRHFEAAPAPATFPARRPLLPLDRLWVRPRAHLRRVHVHRTPLARMASDHLPLVAELMGLEGPTPRDPEPGAETSVRDTV
jgi:endonuclease/exonuclease/phosphatase family metal-dependent hydrolase